MNVMEESNKELSNVTISFEDDLAVLQASDKQLNKIKSSASCCENFEVNLK